MFQSTHPYRVRHLAISEYVTRNWFQSTHPYRVRLCQRGEIMAQVRFNPRTHIECDKQQYDELAKFGVSIHAPI